MLGLSLLGVLSLFVTSVKVAGEATEDVFAATLARSVYDSARVAARERAFAVNDGPVLLRGFVLVERGVSEHVPAPGEVPPPATSFVPPPLPTGPQDTAGLERLRQSDFAVFFPRRPTTGDVPTFVFPRPGGAPADNAGPGVDNRRTAPVEGARGIDVTLDIRRTYPLSHVEVVGAGPTGEGAVRREIADQYSFALVAHLAHAPVLTDPGSPPGTPLDWSALGFVPTSSERTDGLYLLEVLVFRNFSADTGLPEHLPVPGGRYAGLVAVGP